MVHVSCSPITADKRYGQIEKAVLAIIFAVKRFHRFPLGRSFPLQAVLEMAGFDPTFCVWINALYSHIKSVIRVNCFFSEPFSIELSVLQGCPLSPLLHALVSESLLQGLEVTSGDYWRSRVLKISQSLC